MYCLKCIFISWRFIQSQLNWLKILESICYNLEDRLFCCKIRKSAAVRSFRLVFQWNRCLCGRLGGNEIDRFYGGESFTAMRHLNWLNADKLQRYTPSRAPSRTGRRFFCTFSPTPPSPRGRLTIWKFPTGRMCRILRRISTSVTLQADCSELHRVIVSLRRFSFSFSSPFIGCRLV